MSSCGSSNASSRTHGSTRSTGSRNPPQPRPASSLSRLAPTGSGAVTEADFEKAFSITSRMNVSMVMSHSAILRLAIGHFPTIIIFMRTVSQMVI